MNSAINHTCLAVDGRKSCTNPLDNTHYPSALLFNTTTSSTHHCIHIHFIDCVHSSLRTAALGSIASTTRHFLGVVCQKNPGIDGIVLPHHPRVTDLFLKRIWSIVTSILLETIQWVASTWHIWRVCVDVEVGVIPYTRRTGARRATPV